MAHSHGENHPLVQRQRSVSHSLLLPLPLLLPSPSRLRLIFHTFLQFSRPGVILLLPVKIEAIEEIEERGNVYFFFPLPETDEYRSKKSEDIFTFRIY